MQNKLFGYLFLPIFTLGVALPGLGMPISKVISPRSPIQSIPGLTLASLADRSNLKIEFLTKTDRSPSGQCSLKVQYLQLQGLNNIDIQRQINQELLRMPDEAIATFAQMTSRLDGDLNKLCTNTSSKALKRSITGHCTVPFAQGNVISFRCSEMYASIVAYPYGISHSMTFNLATGKKYLLDDLFQDNVNLSQTLGQALLGNYFLHLLPGQTDMVENLSKIDRRSDFNFESNCDGGKYQQWAVGETRNCIVMNNVFGISGPLKGHRFSASFRQIEPFLRPEILRVLGRNP